MKRWPRGQGLSAAALKGVAICSMLLDHALKTLWWDAPTVLYVLGRLAFPLYAFLLVQGAKHTHHMGKYALRLAVLRCFPKCRLTFACMNNRFTGFPKMFSGRCCWGCWPSGLMNSPIDGARCGLGLWQ